MFTKTVLTLKKQCYISYLIFFVFLDKRHWIFFLLNKFFILFSKFLLLYKRVRGKKKGKRNVFKRFNIFLFLKLNSIILNFRVLYKLNKFVFLLKTYSFHYVYLLLKRFFSILKIFFVNIYTSTFLNTFNSISKKSKKYLSKSNYYDCFNTLSPVINKKINFYFIYKTNKNLFFNNFSYFDTSIFYLHNKYSFYNMYYSFLNKFLSSTSSLKSKNYYYNLNIQKKTYLNKYSLKSNIYSDTFFKKIFFKKSNFLYFFNFNSFIIDFLFKEKINYKRNSFLLFIISYNLKDLLNNKFYFLLSNTFYTSFLFFVKLYKVKIINSGSYYNNIRLSNTNFFSQNIINFFIYKKIYYNLKRKSVFKDLKWYKLCNYYYNKIILFKFLIYLLFLNNYSNKFYTNYFKYFLLHRELNFLNIVKRETYLKNILSRHVNIESEYLKSSYHRSSRFSRLLTSNELVDGLTREEIRFSRYIWYRRRLL